MTIPTFAPSILPSPGTGIAHAVKLLEADFGDGYSQPTPDGINHIRDTVSLTWDIITPAQMAEIDGFFLTQKGNLPFFFQPFGYAAPVRWTCKTWGPKSTEGNFTMSATLLQDFSNSV